ncbi:cytochrome P450 76C1-like [Camellia sinensis]|uniref:cytochrome P450 76C1-like n=1 Tax=Camellia sinensis TaxID=4442 RepID=UPI0010364BC7|nr:cytochrome P450 76C1-like [Camellia sinensis]
MVSSSWHLISFTIFFQVVLLHPCPEKHSLLTMLSDLFNNLSTTVLQQWTPWLSQLINNIYEFAGAILTLSILILPLFWYLRTFTNSRNQTTEAPLPPGPRGLPVLGYLPFLGTNLHHSFSHLAHHYGPVFKLWLGNKLYVVITSPSLAKQVVRDQDIVFSNRDPPISALAATYGAQDIAWSSYGSHWRNMRKIFVREMLSNSSLEAGYNLRRTEVRKTITQVYRKIGKPVEIGEIVFLTEFNVVLSMLWGSTFNIQEKVNSRVGAEFRAATAKMMVLLGKPNLSDFFPGLARFDLQGVEREMKEIVVDVERVFDSVIDARVKMEAVNDGGKKDFLQILLELKGEDGATPITKTQIKALLTDIVVGGTDTTATMVEWVMTEIMHNPELMKKVQEELSDIVGMNNFVEEFHLPKLLYLDAVVKETFRLHPAVPLLVPRCPSQSCVVGGYTIPKGTRVFLNVWAIQRDPDFWDNPSEFRPERFLGDDNKWDYTGNNFQYLPFGSGRRICAGIPLAEKMVMYVLASLLHSFNWHLPEGEELDLSEKFGIVIKKETPLIAIPTQRSSDLNFYA